MSDVADILLSQRFLPEYGGSIRWMHEVYRRWPGPVTVITHDYYGHPPRTPEFPVVPVRPPAGDHVTDANLTLDRRDIFLRDWGLQSLDQWRRYGRMTRAVHEQLRALGGRQRLRVHCTHAVPEVVSLLPLKWRFGRRLQVICYAHGEEITACASSRQLKFLMHRAHRGVDLFLANSRYTMDLLARHTDVAKIQIVNPGVQIAEAEGAADAGAAWRQAQGWADRLMVLTVGRLDPRKNHAAVIEAVAALAPRYPHLVYAVVGEGRHKAALQDLAARRGVTERVRFLGAVDGPVKWALYGACDVFAMPAIRDGTDVEGFGMVFLEAGACGKPCLAGREGGQADAVVDGQTGLVVDGTRQDDVTAALERLLADNAWRGGLGAAGQRHAQGFDWPRVVQRTVELVERIN